MKKVSRKPEPKARATIAVMPGPGIAAAMNSAVQ